MTEKEQFAENVNWLLFKFLNIFKEEKMKKIIAGALKTMDPTLVSVVILFAGTWFILHRMENTLDDIKSGLMFGAIRI